MREKGTLIISLDFELLWGVQDTCTVDDYGQNVLGARGAIPHLLKMFEKYEIHATWATVGFMFAESYEDLCKFFPDAQLRPTYSDESLNPYRCFKIIGKDENGAPCFYAPSIIKKIDSTLGQEIASHTFSHYYCKADGQTLEQFKADLDAALKIAESYGYKLTSIILPRNQCKDEYIQAIKEAGFTAYRARENDWIHNKIKFNPFMKILRLLDVYFPLTGRGGYLPKKENGIWNFTGSRMYKPYFKYLSLFEKLKVYRIKKQMLNAAKKGLTFHLWWHPHNIGARTEFHFKQLEEIFSYYSYLKQKYDMKSLNMCEAIEHFEK